ncbi:MAG: hypothetical protein EKK64_00420 [Neisseriaceae bacterium]|nr:MAG: hypothetical protein EKK64_00420 [Neisseriaceae bacterium]
MESKYKIFSADPVVPMSINFRNHDGEQIVISVGVNYSQDKIVFNDIKTLQEGSYDIEDLEQEILKFLRPGVVNPPNLSQDMMEKIKKVQSGKYKEAFVQNMPEGL